MDTLQINNLCYILIALSFGLSDLTELAESYYFKDYLKLQPSQLSLELSLMYFPFIIKPFFGLVSDLVPIFGKRRKYYLLICGIGHYFCWIMMAFFVKSLYDSLFFLFFVYFFLSFSIVLGEAIVVDISKMGKDVKESSVNNISNFYMIQSFGTLFTAYLKGVLLEVMSPRGVFFIASFSSFLIITSGFLYEENNIFLELPSPNTQSRNQEEEFSQISLKSTLRSLFAFIIQKRIFLPTLFIIIFCATPSFSSAYFYFLTEVLKFTPSVFARISLFSAIASILGIYLYKEYFKKSSFIWIVTIGSLMGFVIYFGSLLVALRINVKFGVSDFWLTLFSNSFGNVIGNIMLMPVMSLACVMCPKHLEATVFSFYTSAVNLGYDLSNVFGSMLTSYLGVTSTDYSNLPKLIIVANIMSLSPLLLLFFIQDSYFAYNPQTDLILTDEESHIMKFQSEQNIKLE